MYSHTQHNTSNRYSEAGGDQSEHTHIFNKLQVWLNRYSEANGDQSTHPQGNIKGAQDLDLPEL